MKDDEDEIKEMTPEEYLAYKKAKAYSSIASSISWIAFCFTLLCCHMCSK
jgi:hypothetical protein